MASLRVANITKRYGSLLALHDVSAEFLPGRIHAVLGENGAGKSTLMGVMSGFVVPDSGTVELDGYPLSLGHPLACRRAGVEMIHQHFTLVPDFTVAENIALSRISGLARRADPTLLAQKALSIAEDLHWQVDPDAKVRNLPVGVQQRIEILKALASDAQVVIFDEPTAVLSQEEVADLFRVIRRLRDDGKIVILIAHKLSEVLAVADYVTVLRKGVVVGEGAITVFSETSLAELMVGTMPDQLVKRQAKQTDQALHVRDLVVRGDRGETAVRGATFEVRRAEVLGIGGVDGNGQVELAEALAQVRQPVSGTIAWHREEYRVGYIPQDRQGDGLAMGMTVLENMLVTGHQRPTLGRGPFLDRRLTTEWAKGLMGRFSVIAESPATPVATLSGGNQQKIVVSRTLEEPNDLLVAVNPTRGLDIQATEYVLRALLKASTEGAAVVLFSTDLDELSAVADRVLFMNRGELREASDAASLVGGG